VNIEIDLLPHQEEFLESNKKFTLLLGGVGSAKTTSGTFFVIKMISEYPKSKGAIYANSYKQLINSTLDNVFTWFDSIGLKYSYNKQSGILKIGKTEIICASLDNYDLQRGIELGWYWWDEAAYGDKEAFNMLTGRLRQKKGPLIGRLTTTPKGFNWLYDYFEGILKTQDFSYIKAKTQDNIHLPYGYVDSLKLNYSSKLIDQEINGEFVNTSSGLVYFSFDTKKHISTVKLKDNFPLYVGMDFNVNPMTAVVAQLYDDRVNVIDEFYLENSNTIMMSQCILNKYGQCMIVPDSTAQARKTSGPSDFEILRRDGHTIIQTHNPLVFDRINAVNSLIEKDRVIIDSNCSKLINDLKRVLWKDNKLDQTTDKTLTHISDALGYLIYKFFPLRKELKTQTFAL
jgi:PBSX family phage terminase large subunit